jgi:hypothetical protein
MADLGRATNHQGPVIARWMRILEGHKLTECYTIFPEQRRREHHWRLTELGRAFVVDHPVYQIPRLPHHG